ncbi:MAG: hypothetical protein JWN34_5844 [Bryobacterales bacterium]|nr:hypothetical protein [Bryobacterales bacterium]
MVEELVGRAKRRLLLNDSLAQAAFAGAIMAGGFSLILILGTRYLEWWTLAIVGLAGIGFGTWRVWRSAPTAYTAALRIDRGAGLNDALSTAYYFNARRATGGFVDAQRDQAEAAARSVSIENAVPFTRPPALYAMAALGVFASLLIGLRFAGGHGLDLDRPITEVLFEDQAARKIAKKGAYGAQNQQRKLETAESLLAKLGAPVNPDGKQDPEAALDKALQEALEGNSPSAAGEKGEKGQGARPEDGKGSKGAPENPAGDPLEDKQAGDSGEPSNDGKSGKEGQSGDKAGKDSKGDGQSMLSKLKDAVKDLMNKAGKQNQQGDRGESQQQSAKAEKSGEKGNSGKGQEQKGQEQADSQNGEPSSDSQEGQQSEGKAGAKSAQQSGQSGSGVGSQDRSKEMRAAEQLKAMGKISEIIGKRAQSVTGETTIEVQSGSQQLRTAYSKEKSSHAEANSDVSRDEIPVSLQPYVQQYFEQVRKAAAPKAQAAPKE